MASAPTRGELGRWFSLLRRTDWYAIEGRLVAAIYRERAGSLTPDGYGRGNGYEPRGSETSDRTAAAAVALVDGHDRLADAHRRHTFRAIDDLEAMLDALGRLEGHLTQVSRLVTPDEDQVPPCLPCAAGGAVHPATHLGDVGGRLPRPVRLCAAAYEFVRRTGRIPLPEEAAGHARSGRWRIHVPGPERRPR